MRSPFITDLRSRLPLLLLFLPLAMLLAVAVAGSNNYLLLLLTGVLVFAVILTNYRVALIIIALCSYFLSYAIWEFQLPKTLINFGYLLIVLIFAREFFFTSHFRLVNTPVNLLLVSLLALAFLSIAAGDSSWYPALKGLLRHVGFPLLFLLLLIAEPDEALLRKLIYGIIAVAILQAPASAWQFLYYSTIAPKPPGMRADLCGGLLGPSCGGYTAVLAAMAFCLLLGFMVRNGFRWFLALGCVALLLPIYLASARAGVILFAAAALFMVSIAPLQEHLSLIKRFSITLALFLVVFIVAQSGLGGSAFRAISSFDYVYNYSMKTADSGMGRLQAFEIVDRELPTWSRKLIGRGPGTLTPTSIVENENSLIASNPLFFRNPTGFANTTLELGYLGLLFFILIYVQVYRFNRRFLKQIDDPFWESVSLGFSGVIFIYVISTFYVNSWVYYPLPFTFWGIAAAIYRVGILRGIFSP